MLMSKVMGKSRRIYYSLANALTGHPKIRWAGTMTLLIAYIQIAHSSSHIVTYLIGFYLLHLLLSYFTPQGVDDIIESQPDLSGLYSVDDQIEEQTYGRSCLHLQQNHQIIGLDHEGDKPLARALSEVHIWKRTTLALSLGFICVYFKMLEIDVFWPLLLIYFVGLAGYTVQKILKTMKKHNYGIADFYKQPL